MCSVNRKYTNRKINKTFYSIGSMLTVVDDELVAI